VEPAGCHLGWTQTALMGNSKASIALKSWSLLKARGLAFCTLTSYQSVSHWLWASQEYVTFQGTQLPLSKDESSGVRQLKAATTYSSKEGPLQAPSLPFELNTQSSFLDNDLSPSVIPGTFIHHLYTPLAVYKCLSKPGGP
jgi:hypothetical protein